MEIQHRTNEELQQELLELRQEINSLKTLASNGNTKSTSPEDMTVETSSSLEFALQGGNMAWWEMDVLTGNVTFAKRKVEMLGYAPEKIKNATKTPKLRFKIVEDSEKYYKLVAITS